MEAEDDRRMGEKMTDEDLKTLCKILRTMEPWVCRRAAEEIERLEQELEGMKDHDDQKLLKAEMRCHALEEDIEYLTKENKRLDAIVDSYAKYLTKENKRIDEDTEQPSKGQGWE